MFRDSFAASASLLVLVAVPVCAQVIDFETLPGGAPTVDQQTISDEYASLGVTFTLVHPDTGDSTGIPRIAKTGPPLTAFEGCHAEDTPYAYLGLGESFLTDDVGLGVAGDLRIDYGTPVEQAAGLILDIDCRVSGGAPCEQWTITAYDAADSILQVVVLDGPEGATNSGCASPGAGPGDSEAFGWAVDAGSPVIASIILSYTGEATGPGLAFDNFTTSGAPAVLAVSAAASADSICAGETILLTAFPVGGLPPYTLQWQQETAQATWFDIGTGATVEVTPAATTRYRVVATDTNSDQAPSAELTLAVEVDTPLCSASLIVASNTNSRVVRYSFRSEQPGVFVESGAGGLSGTSEIAIGQDGNLYVSSQNNSSVLRYDGTSGAFIDVFVPSGSGGLNLPVGLEFGPDGNLFVVSNGNHSVLRYDGTTGAFLDVFVPNGSGLNAPTDLTFGSDENLYVCSLGSDKILYFDGSTGAPLGDFVASGSGGLDAPRGMAFGPDDNLYVCEQFNDSVRRYNGTTGAFVDVFIASGSGGLDRANDLVFAPNGVLYVASFNNDMVLGYDAENGVFLGALPNEPLNGPAWVAVGLPPPVPVGVPELPSLPLGLRVERPVPNPFAPSTTIAFTLATPGHARAMIVDVTGRRIATLSDRSLRAGRHTIQWDGRTDAGAPASAGIYFVQIESGGHRSARRLALVR